MVLSNIGAQLFLLTVILIPEGKTVFRLDIVFVPAFSVDASQHDVFVFLQNTFYMYINLLFYHSPDIQFQGLSHNSHIYDHPICVLYNRIHLLCNMRMLDVRPPGQCHKHFCAISNRTAKKNVKARKRNESDTNSNLTVIIRETSAFHQENMSMKYVPPRPHFCIENWSMQGYTYFFLF